jgi:predicted dehydrogenase
MAQKRLKVAMIGVGDITTLHFEAYRDFPHAVLTALCDANPELLQQRAAEWGVSRTTADYHDFLRDPEIDIVEVNTPHHLHRRMVVDALEAGKHVACQKPLTTTLADGEAMVEASQSSRGRFRVLENFVFYPPYVKAKELIDGGEIGEPLTARFKLGSALVGSRWIPLRSELWHLMESENGMGQAVFDDGYHKLSLAIHLFGDIEAVKGYIGRSFRYLDAPAQLLWRHKGKPLLGSFDIAFSPNLFTRSKYFPADERVDIVGTRGVLTVTRCTGQLLDQPSVVLARDGKRYLFDDLETDWQASFTAGIRDFPLAIREDRETLLSGERALEVLRFAFALIVAARLGTEIRPDEVTDEMITRGVRPAAAAATEAPR